MKLNGVIKKMLTEETSPVHYYLNLEDDLININDLLNKKIKIQFDHYECLNCHENKEIFAMGFCQNCYFNSAYAGEWIIRPELSKAHLGKTDRNFEIEANAQLQPHIVYLANTGNLKVGVTRKSQLPTRWIDQGAEYATYLAETTNRYEAGLIEVALKKHISDKTNYKKMLSANATYIDLEINKNKLTNFIPDNLKPYIITENKIIHINYPIYKYPNKIKSVTLKKQPDLESILIGIKGQYLIFEDGRVFNIRNHEGYFINLFI